MCLVGLIYLIDKSYRFIYKNESGCILVESEHLFSNKYKCLGEYKERILEKPIWFNWSVVK